MTALPPSLDHAAPAQVYLVGCGTGDVELLTIKAYHAIKKADVILYDHLITPEILELIPYASHTVYVGKQKGCHSRTQTSINALIVSYVKKGLSVARLKSGDPYIFGRGAEEAMYLKARGYRVEVIAGISSAITGPASAGIPPTARGCATAFSVVSAHVKGGKINLDWINLLSLHSHTTIVLMGLSLAGEIRRCALENGIDPLLDAAIVSQATSSRQQTRITTLDALESAAESVEGPAVIIFGNVVKLHRYLPKYRDFYEFSGGELLDQAAQLFKHSHTEPFPAVIDEEA